MKISKIALPEKTVTFDFPGCDGLTFDITYLTKDELLKLLKKCSKQVLNKKTRQYEEQTDSDKFMDLYAARVIKGWDGFKVKYLTEFVLADISECDPDEEIEYQAEEASFLLKNSQVLDDWVSMILGDLENFTKGPSAKKLTGSKST